MADELIPAQVSEEKKNAHLFVKLSPGLKQHLDNLAAANEMTLSEYVRVRMVKDSGYKGEDPAALDGRGRRVKYKTEDERVRARRASSRNAASKRRNTVDAVAHHLRLDGAEALRKWLVERGIDPDAPDDEQQSAPTRQERSA